MTPPTPAGTRPVAPNAGVTWYRGWECIWDEQADSWVAEGWRAYKGGVDLDAPTASAKTWEALLDEIDAEEEP